MIFHFILVTVKLSPLDLSKFYYAIEKALDKETF